MEPARTFLRGEPDEERLLATLVLQPGVQIRIDTARHGIIDVSDDVSYGTLIRSINAPSLLRFSLLNHRRKYDGVFTPNDRISVQMKRIRWMQVFAGYLNTIPFFTVYARTVDLTASCTLKALQYRFWDPGALASWTLLHGSGDSNGAKGKDEVDGGLKKKAIALISEVGGWPLERIHMGEIPHNWFERSQALIDKVAERLDLDRQKELLGAGTTINGTGPIANGTATTPGIGPGTGALPATSGRVSAFGGPGGGAYGNMALTGESGVAPRDPWYCLPGYSVIYTDSGPVKITDVQVGDRVWAFDGHRLVCTPVTGKIATGEKPLWCIRTKNHTLDSTFDHRVLVLTREGTRRTPVFEWREAQQIEPGDVVVTTGVIPETGQGEHPDAATAEIVGLLVADGLRNARYREHTTAHFHGGPKRFDVCLPPGKLRKHWIPRIETALDTTVVQETRASGELRCCMAFHTDRVQRWCAEVMREKSPERFVPSWVWTAPRKVQQAFLDGYMSGDGTVGQRERTQGTHTVSCASERLATELRILCHYLGYRTGNLAKHQAGGYRGGPAWRFVFYPEPTRRQVPTSYARAMELDETLAARTVLESGPLGTVEQTWDLEVDGPASFVSDGVVVHNCAMRWGYVTPQGGNYLSGTQAANAKRWWTNRKILVVNPANQRAVVLRAADWGPHISTGRVLDISPHALHSVLGSRTDAVVQIAFAQPTAPLGPAAGAVFSQGTGSSTPLADNRAQDLATVNSPGVIQAASGARFAGRDGLKPNVAAARDFIKAAWNPPGGIGGVGARSGASDHPLGLALDAMVRGGAGAAETPESVAMGNAISQWFVSNPSAFGTKYVIWYGQINTGSGWRPYTRYADQPSNDTLQHRDHPHISFHNTGQTKLGPMGGGWPGADMSGFGGGIGGSYGGLPDPTSLALNLINAVDWYGQSTLSTESQILAGPRALLNDSPLLPYVGMLIQASMRHYCSAPNGDLISWFPDYFGLYSIAARMTVRDIELQDFTVVHDDQHLKTHWFVAGAATGFSNGIEPGGPVEQFNKYTTSGIVSVEMPEVMEALFNVSAGRAGWGNAKDILQRFGARPQFESIGTITGGNAEFWYALSRFQLNWAMQFHARAPLTFMPELFPGMLLHLPDRGFQAYISQVTHTWDMSGGGFTTEADIIAPSATDGSGLYALPKGADPTKPPDPRNADLVSASRNQPTSVFGAPATARVRDRRASP